MSGLRNELDSCFDSSSILIPTRSGLGRVSLSAVPIRIGPLVSIMK